MKIVRIDAENNQSVVAHNLPGRVDAIRQAINLARQAQQNIPNDPKVEQSGAEEVSVSIGINRILTFRVVE